MVIEAPDLGRLRAAILEVARTRRRDEGRAARPWKVAYVWGVDIAERPKGLIGSLLSSFKPGPKGPVLEVTATATDGYLARAEDGSTVSGATLDELNQRARQRFAPLGGVHPPDTITLFEVLDIPAEDPPPHGS